MPEPAKTLIAGDQSRDRMVFGADDKQQKLKLAPSREAVEKIRRLEESFAMAEQNLGTLRVG